MNKKLIILIIFSILLLTFLNGCFGEDKNDNEKVTTLIGSWNYFHGQLSDEYDTTMYFETLIYNFFENNEFSIHNIHNYKNNEYEFTYFGIYNTSDNKITFFYDINIDKDAENYSYQIKNNVLILTPIDGLSSEVLNLNRYRETPITYEKISEDKHFTEPINKIEPTIDDLPDGYIKCQNSSDYDLGYGFSTLESYTASYFKGNCSNYTDGIIYSVIKFKTSNIAHLYYIMSLINMNTFGHLSEMNTTLNIIGDESIAFDMGPGYPDSSIYFRIKNVVCYVNSNNCSTIYNISKDFEEKINTYLE